MYLDAVEQAVSIEKMNNTSFNPNSCDITKEGNLYCERYEDKIEVEVKGEKPINGNITFEEGKITNIRLEYKNDKVIIKDEDGNLVYEGDSTTLEGNGQSFHKFAPSTLTFRSPAPLSEFQEVQIDGVTLDPSHYTKTEGSTIVTLSIDYLKTLEAKEYTISVVSDSGAPSAKFEVIEPELNEHGFYYNQPYTAYVAMLGGKKAFFLREDGTLDVIDVKSGGIETGTFTCDGKNASMTISIGTLTGTWADDGKSIYCNELQVTASLGDESIISDEDYIYIYNEDLGGYEVKCIDKTQSEHGAIKTGINGIDTVKLATESFVNNKNLVLAPQIPDTVTIIGAAAFRDCSNLKDFIIPFGIKEIGGSAFSRTKLNSIEIPNSVTQIGSFAFSGCSELTSITIPSSITSFGLRFLDGCTNLINIKFEGTVEQWNAIIMPSDNGNIVWNNNVPATYVQCSDGVVPLQ